MFIRAPGGAQPAPSVQPSRVGPGNAAGAVRRDAVTDGHDGRRGRPAAFPVAARARPGRASRTGVHPRPGVTAATVDAGPKDATGLVFTQPRRQAFS
ncbi:hypothetical protein Franean1_4193 [Parafrankia sp. EAN1pec]|nr:hypothetical protein Franean1_4193 [Frankia sp. EAN1pec]